MVLFVEFVVLLGVDPGGLGKACVHIACLTLQFGSPDFGGHLGNPVPVSVEFLRSLWNSMVFAHVDAAVL